jgi:XTP/dITP diphosphohydrolase
VLATANRAKAGEMAALLAGLPVRIAHLGDLPGVVLPPEGETSYVDNALGKARAAASATGHVALADDSGIEVNALGGRPGVLSARFGGGGLDDAGRNAAMLDALRDVPAPARTARYRAVIALVDPRGREAVTEGVVEGLLLAQPRGSGGFGYDPLFFYPPFHATFAELPAELKHTVSHRGVAMARARAILAEWLSPDLLRERVPRNCVAPDGGNSRADCG